MATDARSVRKSAHRIYSGTVIHTGIGEMTPSSQGYAAPALYPNVQTNP
jgi:hypothetical protein